VPYAVRFKIPDNVQDISFHDLILGDISVSVNQLDDFIIARSDGMPVYNFVVVIDDAYMRISHVIRAQEHLNNTPKQLLLYQALGFEVPQFAHIPLILGKSGQKLSKREGATAITEYQAMGFLPDALLNYLARLGWAHGDQEIFSRDELISFFSLEHVGKSGAIFDIEKLRWVNAEHIKRMAAQDLLAALVRDVAPDFTRDRSTDVLLRMIELYKTRVSTLAELVSEINLVMNGPQEYENAAVIAWFGESAREHVRVVCELLRDSASWQTHDLETTVRDYAKQHALPLATLAQPVRIALVGKTTSPGVFHLLEVLGKEKSIERLEALLKLSS
jgi:glutamyl-tRNA synthetase